MSILHNKQCITIVLAIIFVLFPFFSNITSASPNVEDCLNGAADCEEESVEPGAATDENDFLEENNANDSLFLNIIKLIFALLLVLALIFIAIRFLGKRNNLFQHVQALENLGGISLGPNRSIQIVRVGKKFYLIGVGDSVELLDEITDEQLIKQLTKQKESSSNFLQMAMDFKKNSSDKSSGTDFKNLFKTELDQLKQNRKTMINQYKEDRHE